MKKFIAIFKAECHGRNQTSSYTWDQMGDEINEEELKRGIIEDSSQYFFIKETDNPFEEIKVRMIKKGPFRGEEN